MIKPPMFGGRDIRRVIVSLGRSFERDEGGGMKAEGGGMKEKLP